MEIIPIIKIMVPKMNRTIPPKKQMVFIGCGPNLTEYPNPAPIQPKIIAAMPINKYFLSFLIL